MKTARSHYFVFIGLIIALLLPFSLLIISISGSWWGTYLSWVAFFMQGVLMVLAGALTYGAAYNRKILGGIIGLSLRIFSVGLFILGLGVCQAPFLQAYGLWNTPYVANGWYTIPYIIGGVSLIISLLISRSEEIRRALLVLGIMIAFGLLLRFALGFIPFHTNTYYSTMAEYSWGITQDVLLLCIVTTTVSLSLLHRSAFGVSKIGHIFNMQVAGYSCFFIPAIANFFVDMVPGWNYWYTHSLGGNIIFAGSFLLASVLFYQFGLYLSTFQLS